MGALLIDLTSAAGESSRLLCAPDGVSVVVEHIALDWYNTPLKPATIVVPPGHLGTLADELAFVGRASEAGAAGVVLLSDSDLDPVVAAARQLKLAVLRVSRDGNERQVLDSMLLGLSVGGMAADDTDGGGGDLYALSQVMAEVLGAPVTIDDPEWRLLAHSPCDMQSVDRLRIDFILERRPPAWFIDELVVTPEYHRLRQGGEPVRFSESADGYSSGRVGIPIVAGTSFLGSVWAINGELASRSTHSAKVKSLQSQAAEILMLRKLEGARAERRAFQQVQTLMARGEVPPDILEGTPLAEATRCVVLVVEPVGSSNRSITPSDRLSLERALFLARACWRTALCTVVGRRVYCVVGVDGSREQVLREAAWFAERVNRFETPVRISVGAEVDIRHAHQSRDNAERALSLPAPRDVGVTDAVSCQDELLLADVGQLAMSRESHNPRLQQLLDHDSATGSELVPTLAAYLDSFGDVKGAARALFVHPNTVRHRLERAANLTGLDLSDPTQRLALQVQLTGLPFGHR